MTSDIRVGVPAAVARQGVHADGRADAGAVHRRQHGAVFGRPQRPAAAAAGAGVRPDRADGQRLSGRRRARRSAARRACPTTTTGCARRERLRGTGALQRRAISSIDQNGTPTRVRVTLVTPSFFRLLRVAPALGRTFSSRKAELGNEKKAVLSYALWQSQFGGDPQAIGKDIRLDGQPLHASSASCPRGSTS